MTALPPRPPRPPRPADGEDRGPDRGPCATATSVAGLAREVEAVRRSVDGLVGFPARLEEIASLLARLAEDVADAGPAQAPARPEPSWLQPPGDAEPADAQVLLEDLAGWIGDVYLAYPDGARGLPGCWLWHPHAVEELLWLRRAWLAAYTGPKASSTAVGDWHDRQRPGVARRIATADGTCSVENHTPGRHTQAGEHDATGGVPADQAVEPIAFWWTVNRRAEPPAPTAAQLTADAAAARPVRPRR